MDNEVVAPELDIIDGLSEEMNPNEEEEKEDPLIGFLNEDEIIEEVKQAETELIEIKKELKESLGLAPTVGNIGFGL